MDKIEATSLLGITTQQRGVSYSEYSMIPHDNINVEIKPNKFADIDKGVVWLVRWLNSFDSVETFFSCEGEYTQNPAGSRFLAYVAFSCNSVQDINTIKVPLQSLLHRI